MFTSQYRRTWLAIVLLLLGACSVTNRSDTVSHPRGRSIFSDKLAVAGANVQTVTFLEPRIRSVEQPLTLISASGKIISQSVTSTGGRIEFKLPSDQSMRAASEECLRMETPGGNTVSVEGLRTYAFLLIDWQNSIRRKYVIPPLTREGRALSARISNDAVKLKEADIWIRTHRTEFAEGSCPLPQRAAKPAGTCQDSVSAQAWAAERCAYQVQCPVAAAALSRYAGDEKSLAEFIVSNGCVASVMRSRGEDFFSGANLFDLGVDLLLEALTRDFFISTGMDEDKAALLAKGIVIVKAYQQCTSAESTQCTTRHREWLEGPSLTQANCRTAAAVKSQLPTQLQANQARANEIKATLANYSTRTKSESRGLASCS